MSYSQQRVLHDAAFCHDTAIPRQAQVVALVKQPSRKVVNDHFARHFKADSLVCWEGDKRELVIKIKSGVARVYRTSVDGHRQIIAFLYPDDIFRASYNGECHYCIETITESEIFLYTWRGLTEMMKSDAELFDVVCNQSMKSALNTHRHLMTMGQRDALQRVCCFLLSLRDKVYQVDGLGALTLPMQRDIADYLGLTTETVCRQLADLKNRRVINGINRRTITIQDIEELTSLAGECDCDPY